VRKIEIWFAGELGQDDGCVTKEFVNQLFGFLYGTTKDLLTMLEGDFK
jgi:hypothetical protein